MESFAWWAVLVVVSVATFTDLRSRRIPNWLTLPSLAAGLVTGGMLHGLDGLRRSAAGAGLAVLLLAALCFLRGMGWGDLKLCAAVGAWIGPGQLMLALIMMGMAGGLLAMAWLLFHGPESKPPARLTLDDPAAVKLPYAPAIAIGALFSFFAK
jgi:prepilin peptidase CpaA